VQPRSRAWSQQSPWRASSSPAAARASAADNRRHICAVAALRGSSSRDDFSLSRWPVVPVRMRRLSTGGATAARRPSRCPGAATRAERLSDMRHTRLGPRRPGDLSASIGHTRHRALEPEQVHLGSRARRNVTVMYGPGRSLRRGGRSIRGNLFVGSGRHAKGQPGEISPPPSGGDARTAEAGAWRHS
jgi:hypothetical protein